MYDLYGYFILALFLVVMIIISIVLRNHLIDKDYQTRYAPLLVIAFLIVALDVSKQLGGLINGYERAMIPLYFCSLFNILYPLAAFSRGKLKQISQVMSSVYSFIVLIGIYLMPQMMIGDAAYGLFKDFSNFHTFVYHHLVALYALLSISLQLLDVDARDDIPSLLGGALFYNIIGGISAFLLKVNFHNFYPTSQGFFLDLRLKFGNFLYISGWGFLFLLTIIPSFYLFKLTYDLVGPRRIVEEPQNVGTLK